MVSFSTLASLLCLVWLLTISSPAIASFTCTSTGTCDAIIDYTLPNATTFNAVKKSSTSRASVLFSALTTSLLTPLLIRNSLLIKPLKSLSIVFVETELQAVNNISNPNLIQPGDKLWVPLPCSCDDVDGEKVVHYGRLVTAGSTIEDIAQQYNVSQDTLLRLNGLASPKELLAGSVLDVPLKGLCSLDISFTASSSSLLAELILVSMFIPTTEKASGGRSGLQWPYIVMAVRYAKLRSPKKLHNAWIGTHFPSCRSMVNNTSLDYPLLVPNDTYVFTAANCVTCKCDAANNWTLQCQPSQIKSSLWKTCPSTQCQGLDNFYIGNVTSSDCNSTACAYAGYSNQTIFTTSTQLTCPASGNSASGLRLGTWRWNIILVTIHMVFLSALLI
ncbi:hypothetical protein RND71_000029 [Anisodus tanguticus]|uniref:LysM domain-containing protein n=1 Tax=Anisodus tanguticus TaxID=243964 RepID=A0AAE1SZQ2_9SOLA|nr:hypothetical protein RND71_000029 [Anisodus tanguticus]